MKKLKTPEPIPEVMSLSRANEILQDPETEVGIPGFELDWLTTWRESRLGYRVASFGGRMALLQGERDGDTLGVSYLFESRRLLGRLANKLRGIEPQIVPHKSVGLYTEEGRFNLPDDVNYNALQKVVKITSAQ